MDLKRGGKYKTDKWLGSGTFGKAYLYSHKFSNVLWSGGGNNSEVNLIALFKFFFDLYFTLHECQKAYVFSILANF